MERLGTSQGSLGTTLGCLGTHRFASGACLDVQRSARVVPEASQERPGGSKGCLKGSHGIPWACLISRSSRSVTGGGHRDPPRSIRGSLSRNPQGLLYTVGVGSVTGSGRVRVGGIGRQAFKYWMILYHIILYYTLLYYIISYYILYYITCH